MAEIKQVKIGSTNYDIHAKTADSASTCTGNAASVTNGIYVFPRSFIGISPNFDNPGHNGLFEVRSSSETTGETGDKPFDSFGPMLSLKTPDNIAMLQIAGVGDQYYIRGK